VILDDVDHADVLNPLLREKGIKSLLGVPLQVSGDVIGVIHVGSLTPRIFNADDVDLMQLVAERVALAIERAQLHADTVQLDQLKLNFVAIASHELRTPATSVYGVFATLAERWDTLDEETRKSLVRSGYEQGERLRRLLEELLDLSRLDAHSIRLEPKPLVVGQVLAEIAAGALPEGILIELDVAPDLAVVADQLVLDRVVTNLLVNAVRYGSPPYVVSAEQRDRHLRIAVQDSGDGVPEELQPHLFERFARGEDAMGSGLGLAIARAYARAAGGDVVYVPDVAGARFELILPHG
jgi:signal transduction histidine kinase